MPFTPGDLWTYPTRPQRALFDPVADYKSKNKLQLRDLLIGKPRESLPVESDVFGRPLTPLMTDSLYVTDPRKLLEIEEPSSLAARLGSQFKAKKRFRSMTGRDLNMDFSPDLLRRAMEERLLLLLLGRHQGPDPRDETNSFGNRLGPI